MQVLNSFQHRDSISYDAMDPYGRPQLAQPPPPPPQQQQPSKYKLQIEQQPVRARMCGFGDKDRRPITPPPCIRLVIAEDVLRELKDHDGSSFILMVDLWSEDGRSAVNLVRSSNTAATVSISSSDISSYPPQINMPSQPMNYMGHRMQPQLPYAPQYGAPAQPYGYGNPPTQQYYQQVPAQMPISAGALAPSQNHTRNLIGMNAVNACQLNDLNGEKGYWFILQDLSVRTEGTFRLKLSVVDISAGNGQINTGKCPILCHAFSEPFTVYSAKKFPGVIESTPLSKCFAQQGIKIPIRKDGPKNLSNQAEYDADD
ncbi:velvet factor [Paraphoma chrysanthemicola]|nr:velvet factor [Paraphoma chrysanthemicola]